MSLIKPLRDFAASITANFAQESVTAQAEDQLKAPTQRLLQVVGAAFEIKVVPRTEAQVAGLHARPDIGVTTGGLLCGFIELKAPGLGADPSRLKGEQSKRQWQRFQTLPNLIYTDGNEWTLFRTGEQVAETVRLSGDVTEDGADAIDDDDARKLEALLRNFLMWEPIVPHSPRELAHYLAPLTRLVRDEAHAAVERPDSAIKMLADEWRAYPVPGS